MPCWPKLNEQNKNKLGHQAHINNLDSASLLLGQTPIKKVSH